MACCISAIACGEYIRGSSSDRARPSPCSPDIEPPYDATRSAALSTNSRNLPRPGGVLELEVDPHVHAAVAEVAVGNAVQRALLEQRVEVAQVGAELGGRHGGVLPAGLRRAAQRTGRQAGAVLADPPQRELLRDVGDDPVRYAGRAGDLRAQGTRPPPRSQPVTSANSQPPPSGSSGRRCTMSGDPLVEALAGDQRVLQQGGYGVRRVGHRRVAEHGQRAERSVLDQAHGRVEDDAQGALGADEEPVEPAAVLREQVLEGVAGDLAAEATELGADGLEVLVDEGVERPRWRGFETARPASSTTEVPTHAPPIPSASSTVSASTLSTVRP